MDARLFLSIRKKHNTSSLITHTSILLPAWHNRRRRHNVPSRNIGVDVKRDHILMLAAGFVVGAVVTFIVMKQTGLQAPQAVAPPSTTAASQPSSTGAGQPAFDPDQHNAMITQFIERARSTPKDASSKIMLANIYYDKGDFAGAIPWYEEALKLQPENSDVIVDLGVCYRENKQYQKALQLFDQALAVDPKKKQALFNKAVVYGLDLKDGTKAREILGLIEKDYPGDPMAAQLRGSLPKQ